ncbi:MAG: acid phosphatase [Vulcanimicrobiaceae bacterium]
MKHLCQAALALVTLMLVHIPGATVAQPAQTALTLDRLLHQRIKHVFVIYQENRSFDSEFGTFPGANGVWSASAQTHGFTQTDPAMHRTITPFLITDPDVYYESNARATQLAAFDGGQMDRYVAAQEKAVLSYQKLANPQQLFSVGAEALYHVDCETIPYLWAYASRFTLFDAFYQALRAPSTPSNVEIIASQNGLTQYARHPSERAAAVRDPGDPIFVDLNPAFGPFNPPARPKTTQIDQTYANILLTTQRHDVRQVIADTDDVREDKAVIAKLKGSAVPWRWYQEGYGQPQQLGLIAHHLAPHYFGYVVKNPSMNSNLRDLTTFYEDIKNGRLPDRGLTYLKGGSHNTLGLHPANPDTFVQAHDLGDDDNPGYTDSQISQAFVASLVSAIAKSTYWKDSAIIITWDDSGGFWDHATPHNFEMCPDRHPCGDGARVPAIVISPYAKGGAVVHDFNDQNSVLKFIETVFGLPALASLPDERKYLPMGPRDGNTLISNLRGAFDPERLRGTREPLPATSAIFSDATIRTIPAPLTCAQIGVAPVLPPSGVSDKPPLGFNPRPFEKVPAPH